MQKILMGLHIMQTGHFLIIKLLQVSYSNNFNLKYVENESIPKILI